MVSNRISRGVCSLLKWHGPGAVQRQNAECRVVSRPIFLAMTAIHPSVPEFQTLHLNRPRASLRNRVSKTQSVRGSTEAACQCDLRFTIYDLGILAAALQHAAASSRKRSGGSALLSPRCVDRKSSIVNHPGVVADKQCTCPASRFMWERYPPTPPFLSNQ